MSMLTPRGVGGSGRVRRRGRAGRLVLVVAALLVLGVAVAAVWYVRDDSGPAVTSSPTLSCRPPSAAPTAVAAAQVRVNVYNATKRRGLAARVATQLRKRGFRVAKVANDPAKRKVTGVAEVRASTVGARASRTVGAQVASFVAVPDQRRNASVDLVIGASFRSLRSAAAAAAALRPTAPPRRPGC